MRNRLISIMTHMVTVVAAAGVFMSFGARGLSAADVDCSMCHPDLAKKKTVHAAVNMGCPTCHTSLNAAEMPHKVTGKVAKGLSADQPDLCYGCHDKGIFSKKNVHAALAMGCASCHNPHSTDTQKLLVADMPGLCYNCHDKTKFENKTIHPPVAGGMCTSCHNPHSSDSQKLLLGEAPDLCYTCHDKKIFSKKNVHSPVAGGMCLSCHGPHATAEMALLPKRPAAVCVECHPDVLKRPHALGGTSHPLGAVGAVEKKDGKGTEKKERILMDPARPGKEFSCGSCHNPHSSDSKGLMRYTIRNTFELCVNCHKK